MRSRENPARFSPEADDGEAVIACAACALANDRREERDAPFTTAHVTVQRLPGAETGNP
jgi:hypothetical protein